MYVLISTGTLKGSHATGIRLAQKITVHYTPPFVVRRPREPRESNSTRPHVQSHDSDNFRARAARRANCLEKQVGLLSGQMSTIMDKLENISITLESQPSPVNKEKTKRMRSCHARDPLRNPHPVRTPKLRRWPATQNRRRTTLEEAGRISSTPRLRIDIASMRRTTSRGGCMIVAASEWQVVDSKGPSDIVTLLRSDRSGS